MGPFLSFFRKNSSVFRSLANQVTTNRRKTVKIVYLFYFIFLFYLFFSRVAPPRNNAKRDFLSRRNPQHRGDEQGPMMDGEIIVIESSPIRHDQSIVCLSDTSPLRVDRIDEVVVELSSDEESDDEIIINKKLFVSSLPSTSPSRLYEDSSAYKLSSTGYSLKSLLELLKEESAAKPAKVSSLENSNIFDLSDDTIIPRKRKGSDITAFQPYVGTSIESETLNLGQTPTRKIERSLTLPTLKPVTNSLLLVQLPLAKRARTLPSKPSTDENFEELLEYYKDTNMRELNSVNKANRTKDEMMQEMIVTFDESLQFEQSGLQPSRADNELFNDPLIKWKREVNAVYYKDEDIFIPTTTKIIEEPFVALFYRANDEFVTNLQNGHLQSKLQYLRTLNKDHCIILIIEGQDQYLQKLKTKENRNYTTLIRKQFDDQQHGRATKLQDIIITKNEFDDLLIDLQINHKIHLFPTKTPHDTMTWLKLFTYTIASLRYDKFERLSEFANIGVVKSGGDLKDCFLRSLQHFKFITPLVSEKIYKDYKTINELNFKYTRDGRIGKNYVRESIDIAINKFFKSDNANDLLID